MQIQVPSTTCDVISFNDQGQFCPLTCAEIFQTIQELDSVMEAEEKGKKPCNIQIDPKMSVKILFH